MPTERQLWAGGSVLALALVLSPLVRGRDGFPLSNYPMFAEPRSTSVKIHHVVGVTHDERSRPLPPPALGTDEIMQASQTARFGAKNRERAEDLCVRVADEVARGGEAFADIAHVEVRTDEYDAIRYWQGDRTPVTGKLHARCDVRRSGP